MELQISKTRTIKSIQEEFQKNFPCLKIEFYSQGHFQGKDSSQKDTLSSNLTIKEVQKSIRFPIQLMS